MKLFSERLDRSYLWCLWCVWVLTVCGVQLWRLTHLNDTGFDLAIYSQVLWSATHGGGWWSSIQDHSYWSDHLEPVLWLYWPLMKMWWSPLWLLWSQTLVIASCIFPLYRIARRALTSSWALAVPVLFLTHASVWAAATLEFHVLTLALPLIFWACLLLIEPKTMWWQWPLVLLALAMIREEMGLVVVGFGLLALIKKKDWRWWLSAVVIGGGWLIAAHVIQAAFIETYRFTYYYPWIDLLRAGHHAQALMVLWQTVWRVENARMVLEAVMAFGIVWVFSAEWLLPAVPVIGSFLLINANVSNALVEGYHATVPMALMFVALPFGVVKAHHWLTTRHSVFSTVPLGLFLTIVGVIQLTTWYAMWGFYPTQASQYQPAEISALLQPIELEDGVAASAAFLPLLGNRSILQSTWYVFRQQDEFFSVPYTLNPKVDWVVFDTNEFLDQRTQKADFFQQHQLFLELLSTQFTPVDHLGSVILYQRTSRPRERAAALVELQTYTSGTLDSIPPTQVGEPQLIEEFVVPGPDTQLVGNHLRVDFYLRRPNRWRQLEAQHITPIIRITNGDQELRLPLAYGLVGPDTMQEGDRVVMDVILPERMLRAGKSNPRGVLEITGELVRLDGVSYGRHASLVMSTSWLATFLDKTVPLQ